MRYGKISDLVKVDLYTQHCVDGKCSGCGDCCIDLLPLTDAELEQLKKYANEHNLKEHRHSLFFDKKAIDLTCPFRNNETKQCDVYAVRPQICREFICSKSLDTAKNDRDSLSASRITCSLRYEVFGNRESLTILAMAINARL
jgi:Fe-S-cluster containining protein